MYQTDVKRDRDGVCVYERQADIHFTQIEIPKQGGL